MKDLSPEKRDEVEAYIDNLLNSLCVPKKCKGFAYIAKSVYLAACDPTVLHSMTNNLFGSVAKMFGVTATSLEAAITRAVKSAWKCADAKTQFSLFGRTVDFTRGYPGDKDFIAALAYKVRIGMHI